MKKAAKKNDAVSGVDIHNEIKGQTTIPVPHNYDGYISDSVSSDVFIEGLEAATVDSVSAQKQSHTPKGGSFVVSPNGKGHIKTGSLSVYVNGKAMARDGDFVITCSDIPTAPSTIGVNSCSVEVG